MNGQASEAYDLSLYESRAKKDRQRERQMEILPKTTKKKKQSPIKLLVSFACILSLVAVLIYSKVQLTEIGDDIIAQQNVSRELEGERTRLSLLLEGKTSYKTIEEYATEKLGLSKISSSQIQYISLCDGNKAEVLKDSGLKSLMNNIKEYFEGLMAYIGL